MRTLLGSKSGFQLVKSEKSIHIWDMLLLFPDSLESCLTLFDPSTTIPKKGSQGDPSLCLWQERNPSSLGYWGSSLSHEVGLVDNLPPATQQFWSTLGPSCILTGTWTTTNNPTWSISVQIPLQKKEKKPLPCFMTGRPCFIPLKTVHDTAENVWQRWHGSQEGWMGPHQTGSVDGQLPDPHNSRPPKTPNKTRRQMNRFFSDVWEIFRDIRSWFPLMINASTVWRRPPVHCRRSCRFSWGGWNGPGSSPLIRHLEPQNRRILLIATHSFPIDMGGIIQNDIPISKNFRYKRLQSKRSWRGRNGSAIVELRTSDHWIQLSSDKSAHTSPHDFCKKWLLEVLC